MNTKNNPSADIVEEWEEERQKKAILRLVEVAKKGLTDSREDADAKVTLEAIEQEIKNSES